MYTCYAGTAGLQEYICLFYVLGTTCTIRRINLSKCKYTCILQNQETEEVSGVSRVVVWPAPPTIRPLTPTAGNELTGRTVPPAASFRAQQAAPPPQSDPLGRPFHWMPRVAAGDTEDSVAGTTGDGESGGRGRSRSRSRAIIERAKSFERAGSSGKQDARQVSRERRPTNRKRSPSGRET
jgi:hypothetical protein